MSTQPPVLVADERRITKLVSMALSDEGFRAVTAASGEEALAKAEEVRPDFVLLDIVMPDLDGMEVMRQGWVVPPGAGSTRTPRSDGVIAARQDKRPEEGDPGRLVVQETPRHRRLRGSFTAREGIQA